MALGTDPEAFESRNGYIVEEQGKPPDFVLEIASERTGSTDVRWKRAFRDTLRDWSSTATMSRPKIPFHNSKRARTAQGDCGTP